jgi:hypothetical protein
MCSLLASPEKTSHPVDVGLRSEGAILGRLVEQGYRVLVPFGTNQRYDLVIEQDGRFLTAQCKTGRMRNGAVEFRAQSTQCNMKRTQIRGYAGQVDLFIVFCPTNNGVYVIPAEEVTGTGMYLRVEPTRNRQSKHVRWANDYELPA